MRPSVYYTAWLILDRQAMFRLLQVKDKADSIRGQGM